MRSLSFLACLHAHKTQQSLSNEHTSQQQNQLAAEQWQQRAMTMASNPTNHPVVVVYIVPPSSVSKLTHNYLPTNIA